MCFRCAIWHCKQTWTRHKIINKHEHILPALSSYLGCNCPIHFRNCLEIVLIHIIFEITSKIKIKGVKSGEYTAHSVSHLLHCLSHCRLIRGIGGDPILLEPLFIPVDTSSSAQHCPKLPNVICGIFGGSSCIFWTNIEIHSVYGKNSLWKLKKAAME